MSNFIMNRLGKQPANLAFRASAVMGIGRQENKVVIWLEGGNTISVDSEDDEFIEKVMKAIDELESNP